MAGAIMPIIEQQFVDPGRLSVNVLVLAHSTVPDDFRGTEELVEVARVWAAWKPLTGTKRATYQQQFGNVSSSVVIRYQQRIHAGMYLRRIDDGQTASILACIPVGGGKRWLELVVNEEVPRYA